MIKKKKITELKTESKLPRRNFIQGALLSGVALFSTVKANTNTIDEESEPITLPTPADALVDLLDLFFNIERNLLGNYYQVIGKLSQIISGKYANLRKKAKEFVELVPELKSDFNFSSLQNFTEIGKLTALYFETLSAANNTNEVVIHSNLVKLTLKDFKNITTEWKSNDASTTLSPAAVEKLREVLKLIADLNKPVNDLDEATRELRENSSNLQSKIIKLTSTLKEVIRLLVAAEIIETLTDSNVIEKVTNRLSSAKPPYPTTVAELRELSAVKVEQTEIELKQLVSTFQVSSKLAKYLTELKDKTDLNKNDYIPADVLQKLLRGVANWIRDDELSLKQKYDENRLNAKYVLTNMSSSTASGWLGLWTRIYNILADIMPQATTTRTRQLWLRKKLSGGYSPEVQYHIFYHLIPSLSDPNDVDFYRNDGIRRMAAEELANLQ